MSSGFEKDKDIVNLK